MRFFQLLLAVVVSMALSACGNKLSSASSSNNGFPSVSVKCGTQSCVK
ncbi:MAG: hypothetical protein ACXVLQ_17220 [Bacteriovorax sp.]